MSRGLEAETEVLPGLLLYVRESDGGPSVTVAVEESAEVEGEDGLDLPAQARLHTREHHLAALSLTWSI